MLDFKKIKEYFDEGLWGKERVAKAVEKNKINEEEYKIITGEDYIKQFENNKIDR